MNETTTDIEQPAEPEAPTPEAIRWQHIGHEATLRSVGMLYYLIALYLIASAILLPFGYDVLQSPSPWLQGIKGCAILSSIGLALVGVGYGLNSIKPWVRPAVMALATFGLFSFPIGTIINGYILYLIMSMKGQTVLSADYQEVLKQTSHIHCRIPLMAWAFFGLLLFIVVSALVSPFMVETP